MNVVQIAGTTGKVAHDQLDRELSQFARAPGPVCTKPRVVEAWGGARPAQPSPPPEHPGPGIYQDRTQAAINLNWVCA